MVNAGADAQLSRPHAANDKSRRRRTTNAAETSNFCRDRRASVGLSTADRSFVMASTRFLDRSARVLWARVLAKRAASRPGLQRAKALAGGLILAATAFFVLKGAAMAAGVGLSGAEGVALWLAGPDPVTTAFSATLQPIFGARG
jgi:hypothetical protein